MIKTADHILDLGPEGGDKGGTIVARAGDAGGSGGNQGQLYGGVSEGDAGRLGDFPAGASVWAETIWECI